VRRETGKEVVVQVRRDEGGAIDIGPEPCVYVRANEPAKHAPGTEPGKRVTGVGGKASRAVFV
jgi:hypothetical protein